MHEAGKVLSLHDAVVEKYLQREPESGRVPVQRVISIKPRELQIGINK
jgi:hypothetical protein